MPTPVYDPTFQPGRFVFGYSIPGLAYFGNARTYILQAIFGLRAFGGQIPGKNMEDDYFRFHYGSPVPRATGPWPTTPSLSLRQHGEWAKRIIYRVRRGYQQIARYTPYMGSPKAHLVPWALKLSESSFLWSTLTNEAKARLNADAKRTGQATQGHNYFTKLYIKNDPRWMDYV